MWRLFACQTARTECILTAGVRIWLTLATLACVSCTAAPDTSGFTRLPATSSLAPALYLAASVTKARQANFLAANPSDNARLVADWVVDSNDNEGLPFAVIDKTGAKVFVFDPAGRLQGASFALLGLARGDDSVPGIGSAKLSAITPNERTTPAGRFVAQLGFDDAQSVFWVDYKASIAMHPVVFGSPGDHRFARLASPSALDKRITFGCINVPANFYNHVVVGTFSGTTGIVYVLPEIKPLQDVFPAAFNVSPLTPDDLQIQ